MRRIIGVGSDPRCGRRDISIVITALAAACSTFAACSSARPVHDAAAADARDTSADSPDSSADIHAEVQPPPVDAPADKRFILDGGVCLLPIDAPLPFECRPTFADGTWRASVCPSFGIPADFVFVHEQVCTGYLLRAFDLGTHRWTCYYDPTSGVLVACSFIDDTNDFCDFTTAYILAGEIPPKGTCNADMPLVDPCNTHRDGGADADGAGDVIDAGGGGS